MRKSMNYNIDCDGVLATVNFDGDITFSENMVFREMLKSLSGLNVSECIFDLSKVGMVDSAGLGMFLIAKDQTENAGCKLRVNGATGHVANMLKLTKLTEVLDA